MAAPRIFLGIPVGDTVADAIESAQAELGRTGAAVKWVDPEQMHITLLFFGEISDHDLMGVFRATRKVAEATPPFSLAFAGLDAFPTPRRPKVLWAKITDGAEQLTALHDAIAEPLIESGVYRREDRGFTPHLTLGRPAAEADGFAISAELPKFRTRSFGGTNVTELIVYASELRKQKQEYTVLGRVELGPPDEAD